MDEPTVLHSERRAGSLLDSYFSASKAILRCNESDDLYCCDERLLAIQPYPQGDGVQCTSHSTLAHCHDEQGICIADDAIFDG